REENNLTQVYNAQNLRIVSPPMGKLKPVFPKKATTLILAFLLGLALPAFFIYVRQNVRRILAEDE
ncbi:MAG: chain-length determining protein, partial [Prevotella sp.]|nr:chain-length determining protein [Prevotella sp.]